MGVLLTESALANTYSHPSVADPYEIVEQYRQAMSFGPDVGATRVARSLDIPRGRVRPWLAGGKPDAVHAIDIANEYGWFDDAWTAVTTALAQLCAGVFACGSIQRDAFRPSWTPTTPEGRSRIRSALEVIGVGSRLERDGRSEEFWPGKHPSVLGRTLVAAGAPTGNKTSETVKGLPGWLSEAPPSVRSSFAELLVVERAITYETKATRRIQTSRSASYFRDVCNLIESVTNETVTYSDSGVTISADAIRKLGLS
jgi:hypothetical protein